jgi:exonuclease VII small subunit
MKIFCARNWAILGLSLLMILTGTPSAPAQNDPQAAIARKQAEFERQRAELEKKTFELKQKQLDLERARQEFQAQQSGRSLSMNLALNRRVTIIVERPAAPAP